MKIRKCANDIICYIFGLLIISVGINISKISGCGISPASSLPRVLEVIKNWTLGTTTIVIYCILVLFQFLILGKNFKIKNILGILVAMGFGFMINFIGTDEKAFGHLLINFPQPENYVVSLFYLLFSMLIIAFGVYLYLLPNLIPMPAEGLAEAISIRTKLKFGDCKTIVDTSLIIIAIILQFSYFGGIKSFTNEPVMVREGTIVSALCIGQIVKVIKKFEGKLKKRDVEVKPNI